jgi:hypothetical protein
MGGSARKNGRSTVLCIEFGPGLIPKWTFIRFLLYLICFANRCALNRVITTPEDLRIFHSDSEKHCKPLYGNFGWFAGQVLGRCLGLLEGNEWRDKRQIFEIPFRYTAVTAQIDVTEKAAKNFVDGLPSLVSTNGADDKRINADERSDKKTFTLHAVSAFMKFPFYLTAHILYGELTKEEEQELWELAEKHMALLPFMVIGGPYRFKAGKWIDPGAYRKLREYTEGWRDCNERMVKRRRAQGIDVPVVSYWDEYQAGKFTLTDVSWPSGTPVF